MKALRGQAGITLIELQVAIVLMLVVMGAALTTLNSAERNQSTNFKQNDSQDQARASLDVVARELRNLASPTNELPQAVNRAAAGDLIFQSITSSGTRRVRYCLDATRNRLWRQTQAVTGPNPPADTTCPAPTSSGWGAGVVKAENVVNGTRPLFAYNSATLTSITEIAAKLYVDVNPGKAPDESVLETTIFLRNQNRAPIASFTADAAGLNIKLNGSASRDPEEKALDYYWYDSGKTGNDPACGALPAEVPQTGCIGTGIVYTYTPPANTNRTLFLVARDPAGLTNQAASKSVCAGVCP